MTFVRPTLSELVTRIGADVDGRLPGADSRLRRSVLDVLVRAEAGTAHGLYGALDFLARQLMPDTAEREYLDRWSTVWDVTRKAAAGARGAATLGGIAGAIVPAGSELARVDGVRFRTVDRAVLGLDGTVDVVVEAVDGGAASVTDAGTQLTFVSPVAGVRAVAILASGAAGGADEETDAALLARLLARIRQPPTGGSTADWVGWALEVPGVTRAWAYGGWMGAGTVGLAFVFDGRPDILPTPGDLATMEAYIAPRRPVAALPVIFAPIARPMNPLISIAPDTAEVRAAVVAELADFFRREAQPGGTIYLSRLNEAISLATGEFDHALRSPAGNFVAQPGEIPMLGTVAWA